MKLKSSRNKKLKKEGEKLENKNNDDPRQQELEKILKAYDDDIKNIVLPMIDDVLFLENQLKYLRGLPFIRVNPHNTSQQKPTPASKQYKELLQQYNNCIKILCSLTTKGTDDGISPLREYFASLKKTNE